MANYRLFIEVTLSSDLPLQELQNRLDIGLCKYGVDENIPEWEVQSISLEGYETHDFQEFRLEPDDDDDDGYHCSHCDQTFSTPDSKMFDVPFTSDIVEANCCPHCGSRNIM